MDSQTAFPADGPIDDYEIWHGELLEELRKETILYVDDLRISQGGGF